VLEAKAEPRKLNDLLMFNFNRWVNQAVAWIPVDWWDACGPGADRVMPSDAELATWSLGAGLDMAQKWDLTALLLVFQQALPRSEALPVEIIAGEDPGRIQKRTENLNYRIAVKAWFWIPEDTMREHEEKDHVPYSQWQKDGLVTATEGAVIDYDRIYSDIKDKIAPRFPRLKQATFGYDPAFATDIALKLRDKAGFKIEEVLQNYKYLSEPAHIFEAFAKAHRIFHDGNRVLRNHVENVAVKRDDAGRIRPVKPRRAAKHIDGVIGMLNGISMLNRMPTHAPSAGVMVV
jgi:phage terminase large subunit-like protein